ncbi:MAG TPA: hypothetical protein VMG33_11855 [Steroidobacteraceae bacterium]|nr:hypothetical protein [Steroidobacteraceae bacterium]
MRRLCQSGRARSRTAQVTNAPNSSICVSSSASTVSCAAAAGPPARASRAAASSVAAQPTGTISAAQHTPSTPSRRCQRSSPRATSELCSTSSATQPLMSAP